MRLVGNPNDTVGRRGQRCHRTSWSTTRLDILTDDAVGRRHQRCGRGPAGNIFSTFFPTLLRNFRQRLFGNIITMLLPFLGLTMPSIGVANIAADGAIVPSAQRCGWSLGSTVSLYRYHNPRGFGQPERSLQQVINSVTAPFSCPIF